MPKRRRNYTTKHARRMSQRVQESTLGTHVQRRVYPKQVARSNNRYTNNRHAQGVVRRERAKRIIAILLIAVVVIGVAVGVGLFVFRSVVGGVMSLKDSDAREALVPVRSNEPSYTLITAELGAVAEPLENEGPDVVLLARIDPKEKKLALVSIPAGLQLTSDNKSESVASIAKSSDAKLISALSTFMKIDISHFVKIACEDDFLGMVDVLGGVSVDVKQEIDDPHAGSICIPAGAQTLNALSSLTFLRADNIEFGAQDRLLNQLRFAAQLISDVFSKTGNLATRLEAIGPYLQTDYSLGDLEGINSWFGGTEATGISTVVLPGYFTVVTNVTGVDEGRYISTSSEVASLIEDLDNNRELNADSAWEGEAAAPSSFTVNVQNGTNIEGAASTAANMLKGSGFKVGDVGNAEQPVYEETLVIYKGDDPQGAARARAVINALGSGRAVDGDAYYAFDSDILLIIGSDNKPVS